MPALAAAAGLSDDVFVDVAVILLISAAAGAIAAWLRQPLVVAFVAVGVIVGPSAMGFVEPGGELELLARIGIALLLFVVGLKLDLHVVRTLGPVAVVAGCGQVALTAAAGFLLALALGLAVNAALYVGIGLAFSSTIIVVKLLSDRREIDDLHGRARVSPVARAALMLMWPSPSWKASVDRSGGADGSRSAQIADKTFDFPAFASPTRAQTLLAVRVTRSIERKPPMRTDRSPKTFGDPGCLRRASAVIDRVAQAC